MALALALAAFIAVIILCAVCGWSLLLAVVFGLLCFITAALTRGHRLAAVLGMSYQGAKKGAPVALVLLLIGMLTASWRVSGTIPFLVYYGNLLILPQFFILFAFLLSAALSLLIGTCYGTVGTIGVVMMVLAQGAGVNPLLTAGAVISGAYFGDRGSPMSSSCNLVTGITETDLYRNIRLLMRAALLPFLLTVALYAVFSLFNPLPAGDQPFNAYLRQAFLLNWPAAIPALLVILLTIFKLDVRLVMLLSVVAAAVVAVLLQGAAVGETLLILLRGYQPAALPGGLEAILAGGGLLSMVDVSLIVLISSAYAGIFAGTDLLQGLESWVLRLNQRLGFYRGTLLLGLVTSAFACNQTLPIILTKQMQEKSYQVAGLSREQLALDLADGPLLAASYFPWNVACAVPLMMLNIEWAAMLYAFYVVMIPLCALLSKKRNHPVTTAPRQTQEDVV